MQNNHHGQGMFAGFTKYIVAFLFSAALISCGGGGGGSGGSGGGGSSSSSANNVSPVANAGEDKTVNAGETVELRAEGSDSDGTITGYTWTQLSGSKVSLTAIDLSTAHFTFVAPPTGAEDSIVVEFRLRVTDDDGATGDDTVAFTVNRVNAAPVVDAGADKIIKGLTMVMLSGTATDSDGDIVSYTWEQVGGAAVELAEADTIAAGFTAPSTETTITLEFRLTVTDSDGASASDLVAVVVTPENAPLISLTFPPATGVYLADTISAFGTAEAMNDATITSVAVSAGGDTVIAMVDEAGHWRADNIPISTSADQFTLVAKATDSKNLTQQISTQLSRVAGDASGSGDPWREARAVVSVPGSDIVYVLTRGSLVQDTRIVPVDRKTGHRGASITDFTNAEQGSQNTAFVDMLYDAVNQRLLLSNNPDSDTVKPQIIAVDIATGLRTVIASPEVGSGENFVNPIGLVWGEDQQLLVADNGNNTIFSVDVITGNRTIIADENTAGLGVDAPLFISRDQSRNRLLVTPYVSVGHYFLGVDDWLTDPFGFVFSSNDDHTGPDVRAVVQGVSEDADNDRLLVLSGDDTLIALDLATGNRTLLAEEVTGNSLSVASLRKNMDYDSELKLLYVVDTYVISGGLFVVDPQSGSSVLLSR